MKINELRNLTQDELILKLNSLKQEQFNLRFQHATNQLDNPMKLVEVRKTIAKVKTLLKELELAQ